jgi:hypothetical protein
LLGRVTHGVAADGEQGGADESADCSADHAEIPLVLGKARECNRMVCEARCA